LGYPKYFKGRPRYVVIIIGSHSTKHWLPHWKTPRDLDVLISEFESKESTLNYFKGKYPSETVEVHQSKIHDILEPISTDKEFLDLDLLFTLKLSHAPWNIHWVKTMKDIHSLQCLTSHNESIRKLLYSNWSEVHGKKKVKLDVKIQDFFKGDILREYDHDFLHEVYSRLIYSDAPVYSKISKGDGTVNLCKSKFNGLTSESKLRLAEEEICVFMIERSSLTSESSIIEYRLAFHNACRTLITSSTSGWFNLFLILNHKSLLDSIQRIMSNVKIVLEYLKK
jgi:hypothetical protein